MTLDKGNKMTRVRRINNRRRFKMKGVPCNTVPGLKRVIHHPVVSSLAGISSIVMFMVAIVCLLSFYFFMAVFSFLAALCCAQLDLKTNKGGVIARILSKAG